MRRIVVTLALSAVLPCSPLYGQSTSFCKLRSEEDGSDVCARDGRSSALSALP